MVEVGDTVFFLVEEELLGGGVALHPRPSIVTDLSPDGESAGLWVFGPQQLEWYGSAQRCGDAHVARNLWVTKEEWGER